jgi:hypothetical protein
MIPIFLAQQRSTTDDGSMMSGVTSFIDQILSAIGLNIGNALPNILWAIFALIIGWLVAIVARGFTKKMLEQTEIDNKIAQWFTGGKKEDLDIEIWVAETVYWLIILFTIVAVLQTLKLDAVSTPLNSLLGQITSFLPKIAGAGILLAVAWLFATLSKVILIRALTSFGLDQKLEQQISDPAQTQEFSLSETLGNAIYWFIFLLFLPSILSTLELQGTLVPVQSLLNDILGVLPNILGAVLIGTAGWVIAQIVKRVVTNLLMVTGINKIGEKFGLTGTGERQSLSQLLGNLVYILILIPTAITALDKLQIQAISQPAISMLNQVLNILPQLFAASIILILAYIAGQYIAELVTNILTSVGFNDVFKWLGLTKTKSASLDTVTPEEEGATVIQLETDKQEKTPSELVGIIVLVAIMLVATLTSVDILKIPALTNVIEVILKLAGQVLIALIVFAIGLFLANKAFEFITNSGTRQSKILGHTARISIVTLVSAMALQQMGIAPNIVNLAFGLLVGGIAVAIALAFGLGGRDVAGEQLREWLNAFKEDK